MGMFFVLSFCFVYVFQAHFNNDFDDILRVQSLVQHICSNFYPYTYFYESEGPRIFLNIFQQLHFKIFVKKKNRRGWAYDQFLFIHFTLLVYIFLDIPVMHGKYILEIAYFIVQKLK